MLGSLRGKVSGRLGNRILIEVESIGYWVSTGSWQPEGEITCYLHQHVREDSNELFGFSDLETLALFELLISVSGIGPRAALAILSIGSTQEVGQAILREDTGYLRLAPGIGLKVAQKAVLELKGKVGTLIPAGAGTVQTATTQDDLLEALEGLGYKRPDLLRAISSLPPECITLDQQIRWVLQQKAQSPGPR